MVAARRIIAVSINADQRRALVEISRSRTEPANRVERACIVLAYLDNPSAYAVSRRIGVSQQTVTRCLERRGIGRVGGARRSRAGGTRRGDHAGSEGLACLACAKPTPFGYPHELWTTRLLVAQARDHGPRAGHLRLAKLAQGTVCKILAARAIKPHKSLPLRRQGSATTWSGAIPSSSRNGGGSVRLPGGRDAAGRQWRRERARVRRLV
jgi:hypothetical protein